MRTLMTYIFYAVVSTLLFLTYRKLNLIHKEIKENSMLTQEKIDQLTQQIKDNDAAVVAAIEAESAQVQEAIKSSQVDTTALEQAIVDSARLKTAVENIFEPEVVENLPAPTTDETDSETPTEEVPTEDETPTEELPSEETPSETETSDEDVDEDDES